MIDYHNNFYQKSSQQFKKYEFHSKGKLVKGEKPDFFRYVKKYANQDFKVLDLGCGSGELTLKLSPYFKEIIGIDAFKKYIFTAHQYKKKDSIKNIIFQVANGKDLPFKDECFDIVYSSRGPLSSNIDFMKEGFRVFKSKGLMI